MSSIGMEWKTQEDAQVHLTTAAKRAAVNELFGEFIQSFTQVEDFVLTRDEIQAFSLGFIRIEGTPQFYGGEALGEVCARIDAYVTATDRERFRPRQVQERECVADPRLSIDEVRRTAERQARIQAVTNFEPGLARIDENVVLGLLHEASTEGSFELDNEVFCATAMGTVYPIELMAVLQNPSNRNGYPGSDPYRPAEKKDETRRQHSSETSKGTISDYPTNFQFTNLTRGQEIKIVLEGSSSEIIGKYTRIVANKLALLTDSYEVQYPVLDIDKLYVYKESNSYPGFWIGLLLGGGAGYLAYEGLIRESEPQLEDYATFDEWGDASARWETRDVWIGGLSIGLGAVAGGLIGISFDKGYTWEERDAILQEAKSHFRLNANVHLNGARIVLAF